MTSTFETAQEFWRSLPPTPIRDHEFTNLLRATGHSPRAHQVAIEVYRCAGDTWEVSCADIGMLVYSLMAAPAPLILKVAPEIERVFRKYRPGLHLKMGWDYVKHLSIDKSIEIAGGTYREQ